MGIYTQVGGVEVEAFQWKGDVVGTDDLPAWTNSLAMHTPTDNTLHVPCWNGTFAANMNDWVVRLNDGSILVMPDSQFSLFFDVEEGNIKELKRVRALQEQQAKDREEAFVKATTSVSKDQRKVQQASAPVVQDPPPVPGPSSRVTPPSPPVEKAPQLTAPDAPDVAAVPRPGG